MSNVQLGIRVSHAEQYLKRTVLIMPVSTRSKSIMNYVSALFFQDETAEYLRNKRGVKADYAELGSKSGGLFCIPV